MVATFIRHWNSSGRCLHFCRAFWLEPVSLSTVWIFSSDEKQWQSVNALSVPSPGRVTSLATVTPQYVVSDGGKSLEVSGLCQAGGEILHRRDPNLQENVLQRLKNMGLNAWEENREMGSHRMATPCSSTSALILPDEHCPTVQFPSSNLPVCLGKVLEELLWKVPVFQWCLCTSEEKGRAMHFRL